MIGTAQPKPPKGAARAAVLARRRQQHLAERRVMAAVRWRDFNRCRVPTCRERPVHVCHEEHRGMGGNAALDRTVSPKLVCLCWRHHQAWDHGTLIATPLDPERGFDGPARFHLKALP